MLEMRYADAGPPRQPRGHNPAVPGFAPWLGRSLLINLALQLGGALLFVGYVAAFVPADPADSGDLAPWLDCLINLPAFLIIFAGPSAVLLVLLYLPLRLRPRPVARAIAVLVLLLPAVTSILTDDTVYIAMQLGVQVGTALLIRLPGRPPQPRRVPADPLADLRNWLT